MDKKIPLSFLQIGQEAQEFFVDLIIIFLQILVGLKIDDCQDLHQPRKYMKFLSQN